MYSRETFNQARPSHCASVTANYIDSPTLPEMQLPSLQKRNYVGESYAKLAKQTIDLLAN